MKLLFVCTSLESGRDGVGDYTRLLAGACVRAGHECRMIALNDTHIANGAHGGEAQDGIPALRLSHAKPWHERGGIASKWARDFSPDWQSWQVVPYGFQRKGIIPAEARNCAAAFTHVPGRRHVMLHELWTGLARGEPLRLRVAGSFQRRALKKFLLALRPDALDTTNPAYLNALARADVAASQVPLFGNVPVVAPSGAERRGDVYAGVIFGTIHPQFLPVARKTAEVLAMGCKASGRSLLINIVGRSGMHAEALKNAFAGIAVRELGELPAPEISRLLQSSDFGIATHPWALLGKSGAVAAMLDHGLPVIVPRDDWAPRGSGARPFEGDWPYSSGLLTRLSETPPEHVAGWLARRRAPVDRVPEIASRFLARLSAAGAPFAAAA